MIKCQPTWLQKATVALMVSVLTFGKMIGCFLNAETRCRWLWEANDGLALILDVVLVAVVAFGLSELLRLLRLDCCRKFYNHCFLLVAANGALTTLAPARAIPHVGMSPALQWIWIVVWLVVLALVVYSFRRPQMQLVRRVANGCLLFSPLIVIVFAQLLLLKTWSSPAETDPALRPAIPKHAAANQSQTPVFIFIFDEWSYRRSFQDGEFLPELANLRRFSAQSYNFHNAWSYAPTTQWSLPALLFQRDQPLIAADAGTYFQTAEARLSSLDAPSIFRAAKAQGYFTALEGFFHPYKKILGDQVDYCRSASWYPRWPGLWGHMQDKLVWQLHWMSDPLTTPLRNALQAHFESRRWFAINTRVRDEALRLMDECPTNTFAVFHWPLPHGPFVMKEDDSYRVPYAIREVLFGGIPSTVDDYHLHLKYLDKMVGQIVARLKAAGKYDNALMVMTSDHSWRQEPELLSGRRPDLNLIAYRKIPLLIKFPGQQTGQAISKTVYNHLALKPILDYTLRGQANQTGAARIIELLEDLPIPSAMTSKRAQFFDR